LDIYNNQQPSSDDVIDDDSSSNPAAALLLSTTLAGPDDDVTGGVRWDTRDVIAQQQLSTIARLNAQQQRRDLSIGGGAYYQRLAALNDR